MFSQAKLNEKTVEELIEIALTLDLAIHPTLSKACQQISGMAGLCVWRLLADALNVIKHQLSQEVLNFLKKIDEVTKLAINELQTNTKAHIKVLIISLYEYKEGFKRLDYDEKEYDPFRKSITTLNQQGQLVYRKRDGCFFLLVDQKYIIESQKIYGNKDHGLCEFQHAHITLNESMSKLESEKILDYYKNQFGLTKTPLFKIDKVDYFEYLNKTVSFSIIGAYSGIPKTNPKTLFSHHLHVESKELKALAENKECKLSCSYKDYRYHITFAERGRKPYPGLEKINLNEVLTGSELSKQLKSIILIVSSQTSQLSESKLENKTGLFSKESSSSNQGVVNMPPPVFLL